MKGYTVNLSKNDTILLEHLEREVAEAKSQLEEYQATDADTWYATTLAGKIDGLRIAIRYVKGV